jgi:hypothetical protein
MKPILPVVTAFALSIWIAAPGAASAGESHASDEVAASQPVLLAKGGGASGGSSSGSGSSNSYRGYRGASSSRGQGGYQSNGEGGYKNIPSGKSEDQPIPNQPPKLPMSPTITPPSTPPTN